MKPTLQVLAAGMGSRYGGLKQLDGVGPNGETIMDYSIYDAIRSGFGKVIFVIRRDFEADFHKFIVRKYENHISVETVFQSLDNVPAGFQIPEGRTKPWGTNHAVLMGKDVINEPFAVINADDFYGRDSFSILGKELTQMDRKQNDYCMVGFRIGNTLSKRGSVARGICNTNEDRFLTTVVERTTIERINEDIQFIDENGQKVVLDENTIVSMNMWGFTPDYFDYSEAYFKQFLCNNTGNLKSEYFIPYVVNELIISNSARVKVLDTTSKWFGVTYAEDRQGVVDKIQALINAGEYPNKLF